MVEIIKHALGLCGENHLSVLAIIFYDGKVIEQIKYIVSWIRMKF